MEQNVFIGVDLGGTTVGSIRLCGAVIEESFIRPISAQGSRDTILDEVKEAISAVLDDRVSAIGIGVPGLVDIEQGIVYDMVNLPAWKKIPLKELLEQAFNRPVFINNDANCFALGVHRYGVGQGFHNMVGLSIGTGLGVGVILNDRIFNGANCGAGEFGMLPYLDHNYEYYASGQFFLNNHHASGSNLFSLAEKGDEWALRAFSEYGHHLGKALNAVFYVCDPDVIVLGGSVSKAYPYFRAAMERSLLEVEYQTAIQRLKVEDGGERHISAVGAAMLCDQSDNRGESARKDRMAGE